MNWRRVIIESPYGGKTDEETERNLRYLRACMRDCILKGESPFASHGLYTQPGILRDNVPEERKMGIEAGFAWRQGAIATVVYTDLGVTPGMQRGIEHARQMHHITEFRKLDGEWEETP